MSQVFSSLLRRSFSFGALACSVGLTTACVDTSDPDLDDGSGGAAGDADDAGDGDSGSDVSAEAAEKLASCAVPPMEGKVVLGYAPSWGGFQELRPMIDLDTLTHVALAFTNPTGPNGATEFPWVEDPVLHDFVEEAHGKGVKILASIGGAAESHLIRSELNDDAAMDAYIDELVVFLEKFDIDGVDVDIEAESVDETYGPFVERLANRIRPMGKLVTAAVAAQFDERVSDQALFCFDFINEMTYDAAGGWSAPGEHASRSYARTRAQYWSVERDYPAERIVVGMPFYGYCWGSACRNDGAQIPYRVIERDHPDMLDKDWIRLDDLQINFNSAETIQYKTEYGMQNYAGVMVWDLSQDGSQGQLMQAIRDGIAVVESEAAE